MAPSFRFSSRLNIFNGRCSKAYALPAARSEMTMIDEQRMARATSSSKESSLSRRHAAIWSAAALLSLHPWMHVASVSAAVANNLPRTDQPLIDEGKVFLLNRDEVEKLTLSERQILLLNQRIQTQNRTAEGFPSFIREGFDVKVIAPGYSITEDGIIFKDYREGTGESPKEGQEVFFNYTGYNESGATIDSSYRQNRPGEQAGCEKVFKHQLLILLLVCSAAQIQLGIGGLIPGFDLALRTMKVGTQRRFIVPPALGPPVGPSTFFSAKQCEVFDVELLQIRTCRREQSLMFSSVVCE